jgi:hypothetical protein
MNTNKLLMELGPLCNFTRAELTAKVTEKLGGKPSDALLADVLERHREAVTNTVIQKYVTNIRPSVVADYPEVARYVCGCGYIITDYLGGSTTECANCWEVERRLENYLKSMKGQIFVQKLVIRMGFVFAQDFYILAKE